jgi:hypothetical protein
MHARMQVAPSNAWKIRMYVYLNICACVWPFVWRAFYACLPGALDRTHSDVLTGRPDDEPSWLRVKSNGGH